MSYIFEHDWISGTQYKLLSLIIVAVFCELFFNIEAI